MRLTTIGARFATATLLGVLAFGASGVGIAAAANPDSNHAAIKLSVTPASSASLGSGSSFTDALMVSDLGGEGAKDVVLSVQFDPGMVQLQGVQFNQPSAWVTSATPNGFVANLGSIGSNGGTTTISTNFAALPGFSTANPVRAQVHSTWRDSSGTHSSNLDTLLLQSPNFLPAAAAANGVVGVTSAIFNPGEPVAFWYNLPDGTAAALYLRDGKLVTAAQHSERTGVGTHEMNVDNARSMAADSTGQITTSFATAGLTPGAYSIVAHGTKSGIDAVIPFITR